jgi:hypothetical protein
MSISVVLLKRKTSTDKLLLLSFQFSDEKPKRLRDILAAMSQDQLTGTLVFVQSGPLSSCGFIPNCSTSCIALGSCIVMAFVLASLWRSEFYE